MTRSYAKIMMCFVALCLLPPTVQGCSGCLPRTACQEFRDADLVFTGRQMSGWLGPLSSDLFVWFRPIVEMFTSHRTIRYSITEQFKGEALSESVLVDHPLSACGLEVAPGEEFLLYAYRSDSRLMLQPCSRTKRSRDDTGELELLRDWGENGQPDSILGIVTGDDSDLWWRRTEPSRPLSGRLEIGFRETEVSIDVGADGVFELPLTIGEDIPAIMFEHRQVMGVVSKVMARQKGCSQWILLSSQ